MFPLLKKRQEGGAAASSAVIERKPDEGAEPIDMLDAVAEDLLAAFEKKDKRLVKEALTAFAEHLQSMDEDQDENTMKGSF